MAHLAKAQDHWKRYAAIATSQYKPQLLNRIGYVDLNEIARYVEADIAMAKDWKPGTLRELPQTKKTGDVPFRP